MSTASTSNIALIADASSLPPKPTESTITAFIRLPGQIGKPAILRICKELSLPTTTATGSEATVPTLKQTITDHLATVSSNVPHSLYKITSELSPCWYYEDNDRKTQKGLLPCEPRDVIHLTDDPAIDRRNSISSVQAEQPKDPLPPQDFTSHSIQS